MVVVVDAHVTGVDLDDIVHEQQQHDSADVDVAFGVLGQHVGEERHVPRVLGGVLAPQATEHERMTFDAAQPVELLDEGELRGQAVATDRAGDVDDVGRALGGCVDGASPRSELDPVAERVVDVEDVRADRIRLPPGVQATIAQHRLHAAEVDHGEGRVRLGGGDEVVLDADVDP